MSAAPASNHRMPHADRPDAVGGHGRGCAGGSSHGETGGTRPTAGRRRQPRRWSGLLCGLALASAQTVPTAQAQATATDNLSPAAAADTAALRPALPWTRVDAALQALRARDGQGTVVVHDGEGWTIVTEPLAAARWSFTPVGHEAHPAVVRRTIQRQADGRTDVRTELLCEGTADACERLRIRFEQLDERIRQASRGRRAPPMTAASAPVTTP